MEAINLLLLPERGLVQDTRNGDGYLSLKTSSSSLFVSNDTLNNTFALGVLCAFFMLKCHSGVKTCGKAENDEDKSGNDEAKGVPGRRGVTEGDGR